MKKLGNVVFSNYDIVFGGIDSDIVTFFIIRTLIIILILVMINLMVLILKLLIILDLWLGEKHTSNTSMEKRIIKELMSVAWHPTRWWDWSMKEDEQKEIKQFLIDEKCYTTLKVGKHQWKKVKTCRRW